MENALWKNKLLLASEVSKSYTAEKEIRKASGRKELCCPDPDCQNRVLRYCHGEIKDAYFAHQNNNHCDYAIFDSQNTQAMRNLKLKIYESFKTRGYHVKLDVKLLPHHYTHLLFESDNNKKIAVEITTHHISANRVDSLTQEYRSIGIPVKWMIIGNPDISVKENHTYFIKRYALNESVNRDLIVVDRNGETATQYKADLNRYEYNGKIFVSSPGTFVDTQTLDNLVFENGELTFAGFQQRYDNWLKGNKAAFDKKVNRMKENQEKTKKMSETMAKKHTNNTKSFDKPPANPLQNAQKTTSKLDITIQEKSYEERRNEILPQIEQQEKPVWDSSGIRWVKCTECGVIDTENRFSSIGGNRGLNRGVCTNCNRKK